jgi:hypothetical protein
MLVYTAGHVDYRCQGAPLSAIAPTIFSSSTRQLRACQFCRHLEIEHIAGIVFHDVQYPGSAVDCARGGQHLIWHR